MLHLNLRTANYLAQVLDYRQQHFGIHYNVFQNVDSLNIPNIWFDYSQTKYLGFMFNTNAQDDEDMLRQMRTLYIRANKLLRTFHYCSTDVKLELFKSYCTSFYCCYLWTAYKKSTFDRLRVAFNNAYRRVLGQP